MIFISFIMFLLDFDIIKCLWDGLRLLLSCQDPHPIAEILSDPRSTPFRSSDSVPTILRESDTTLTKTPNSEYPPNPPTHYYCSPNSELPQKTPITFSVFICLHHSILVLLNSKLIFMSLSQFSPFCFQYIKPFQYSRSLVLASTLPSYISASFLLNSSNSL